MSDEVNNQGTEVSNAGATTPSVEASQGAPQGEKTETAPLGEGASAASAEGAGQAAPPAYSPNYKYKLDGQEKEFDEWLRPVIKDAETEAKIRDLVTSHHGIKSVASHRDKLISKFDTVNKEYEGVRGGLDRLREHVANGDFDAFFDETKIPLEKVWQWFEQKLQYKDLSSEQKQLYDERVRLRRENSGLTKEKSSVESQMSMVMARTANMELDMALRNSEAINAIKDFDARNGEGSFKQEVIDRAAYAEMAHGKTLSVEEAIKAVLRLAGTGNGNSPDPTSNVIVNRQTKPVIPSVSGTGASPVKKRPQNLKELRADIERRLSSRV